MQQILVVLLLGVALLTLNIKAGHLWLKWVSFLGSMASFGAAAWLIVQWVFL